MCALFCFIILRHFYTQILIQRRGEGGGWVRVEIPRDRLTMCRCSHFHDCIDFYGIAFSDIFNRFSRMELHIC